MNPSRNDDRRHQHAVNTARGAIPNKSAGQLNHGKTRRAEGNSSPKHAVSLQSQQHLLDVFSTTFEDLLQPNAIKEILEPKLQIVKAHLFDRDFGKAFGDPDALRAYAARWSPSRALAYHEILHRLYETIDHLSTTDKLSVLCLGGGGGAELVGLSSLRNEARRCSELKESEERCDDVDINIVDIADWSTVLQALNHTVQGQLGLSSDGINQTTCCSHQKNLLEVDTLQEGPIADAASVANVVTIFFTLNELFTESLPQTQTFLLNLTRIVKKGALLVVVDSAGSYSSVGLGTKSSSVPESGATSQPSSASQGRKYPMAWLLDHVLLKLASDLISDNKSPWVKLEACESRWFRLSEELKYPIKLEDMRYQLHVFQNR